MEQESIIDEMRPADTAACVKILIDNPLWQRYGMTSEAAGRMFAAALAQGATTLAARAEGQPVGFVWYITHGAWDQSGYIRLIGLSPQYQGKRIGEQLMAAAEAHMAEKVREVFLLVTDSNTGAQRFYRRLGYTYIGAIPDYVVPGITELIFFKKLLNGERR
jgi:ribosomal protein S18 acetylase RimI-like enzyme